jgi:Protein of unknown function (DUF4239)
MSSLIITTIILMLMLIGTLIGLWLRKYVPTNQAQHEALDITRTAAGLLATLVALIIGLLVSSAKITFDSTNASITQQGAKIITLDRTLARYGPEAKSIRLHLRQSLAAIIDILWPSDGGKKADLEKMEAENGMEEVHDKIRELVPQNDSQQYLKTQALLHSSEILNLRWMIIEQSQSSLPDMLLKVLGIWLGAFFLSLGLLSPRNFISLAILVFCAVSMAGSLFLILELNRPLDGVNQISSTPLMKAMSLIGK